MSEPFRIGMIGCGTVGSGVLDLLHRRAERIERQIGRPLRVVRIAVRDLDRSRRNVANFIDASTEFTEDVGRVTRGDDIDLVVEVAGGTDLPREWMLDALRHSHDVVTANKAALAFHGEEIIHAARENRRRLFYEASVAGAIPVIEMLQNGLVGNQVTRISAILNGTCNYILTRMEHDGMEYSVALERAQQKGFAEADPSLDVEGDDSAHKLALLAGIVTDSHIPVDRVFVEGITSIAKEDLEHAEAMNYRVKLLGIARRNEHRQWELRVHPTLVPRDDILAQVNNEFNAVYMRGDAVGPMLIYGKGAGSLPTASSVVADIVRAAKGEPPVPNSRGLESPELVPIESVELRNYIRMQVLDAPGVLGRITSFFGMRNISISSIHQPEAKIGQPVSVVLVTHRSREDVVAEALEALKSANLILQPAVRIRIDD